MLLYTFRDRLSHVGWVNYTKDRGSILVLILYVNLINLVPYLEITANMTCEINIKVHRKRNRYINLLFLTNLGSFTNKKYPHNTKLNGKR